MTISISGPFLPPKLTWELMRSLLHTIIIEIKWKSWPEPNKQNTKNEKRQHKTEPSYLSVDSSFSYKNILSVLQRVGFYSILFFSGANGVCDVKEDRVVATLRARWPIKIQNVYYEIECATPCTRYGALLSFYPPFNIYQPRQLWLTCFL